MRLKTSAILLLKNRKNSAEELQMSRRSSGTDHQYRSVPISTDHLKSSVPRRVGGASTAPGHYEESRFCPKWQRNVLLDVCCRLAVGVGARKAGAAKPEGT